MINDKVIAFEGIKARALTLILLFYLLYKIKVRILLLCYLISFAFRSSFLYSQETLVFINVIIYYKSIEK